jgi:hypothetical protein
LDVARPPRCSAVRAVFSWRKMPLPCQQCGRSCVTRWLVPHPVSFDQVSLGKSNQCRVEARGGARRKLGESPDHQREVQQTQLVGCHADATRRVEVHVGCHADATQWSDAAPLRLASVSGGGLKTLASACSGSKRGRVSTVPGMANDLPPLRGSPSCAHAIEGLTPLAMQCRRFAARLANPHTFRLTGSDSGLPEPATRCTTPRSATLWLGSPPYVMLCQQCGSCMSLVGTNRRGLGAHPAD